MSDQVIDLTRNRPSEGFSKFQPTDIVLLAVTGGVGYLAKEAYKYFFPGAPSVIEQIRVLTELIEACAKAGARSVKVRVSTNARLGFEMPKIVKEAKVLSENSGTIDLEVKAYVSVSGDAISGGTASGYGVEQITNICLGGYRERFPLLLD